ncbi:MAG: bifunctional hydroxymethylpyrimidine kinase/phosphomethylpyrimidine kinase [Longimicrobiales bacterium]
MSRPPAIALTIAGSDSGGGAGIQADLKTFHRFGVFGTSVVTAITAQNTVGVHAVHAIPLDVVVAQIDAVATDLRPRAFKTGMLATGDLVDVVADGIVRHDLSGYVLDPVMVATSGHRLLARDAEARLAQRLLPLAALVTPNLDEATILAGFPVQDLAAMEAAARGLVDRGAGAALIKGGHLDGDAVDVFWDGEVQEVWRRPRVDTLHTHGTGCTLSAAVAAGLATGLALPVATRRAVDFVARAIASAPGLGSGRGPVDHFVSPAGDD